MQEKDLAPWEVPPDESYWQALLQEQETDETGTFVSLETFLPSNLSATATSPAAGPGTGPGTGEDWRSAADERAAAATNEHVMPLSSPAIPLAHSPVNEPARPVAAFDSPGLSERDPEMAVETHELDPPPAELSPSEPVSEPLPDAALDTESSPLSQEHAASWHLFCQHRDAGTAIELTVESYNRGGLLVRWEQIVGFVPASQLCDGLRYGDEQARLKDLATRVGSSLTLKVIEVDPFKNRLILSERAARHVADPDLNVLDELGPGDVCYGQVTNLCTFGAFIDLGGVEGLIHISELSWGRVSHPADILSSGQQIEVYVLNVDRSQGRVGLSLKRLQPDPWNSVEERYQVGQVIEGEITNLVNFGAFVRLEEGLEGLIHTSELNGTLASGLYALREGARVLVRINSIEAERHRIGLSLE